ncbi:MAG: Serine/threonine-protein kinase PknD [Steroidobacteraceae bacterium]|nr:Serine/threonine-protein kinase PknD [Steroidobacteraceae bacterium]
MSTAWQELEGIFTEAWHLPEGEQADFIARACGTNAALRADAASLLSAGHASGEFLRTSALERLAQSFAAEGLNLGPGKRIGVYTIMQPLGSGGAGEVWRAKDGRLDRDVAIKVLLPHLAMDTGKVSRFAEEARAAGTLNHPNILTVHDVGEHDGLPYIVSECLEGRNLRERLEAGPMSIAEATAIALDIAQGLSAAHERGIVHRDLKPENTFLKADGGVKLLDFGLAKLKQPAGSVQDGAGDVALSLIAGTAAYMSPEQVRGGSPDPRADLFALGVMMYEMMAGQHPFRGANVFETLHAILTREPADLRSVNARVPPAIARIVMRLLSKAPEARFQSARDLAWSLAQAADSALPPETDGGGRQLEVARKSKWLLLAAPLAVAAAVAVGWWLASHTPAAPPAGALTRFTWSLPAGTELASAPVVAPDGRRVAYVAQDATAARLFVRPLESLGAQAIAGADGAFLPFWSPDGHSLAYFRGSKLMKVSLPEGAPSELADAPGGRGGAWSTSGTIVFAPDIVLSGLSRVPANGGIAEPATLLDPSRGETGHLWPIALPDGVHFLYFIKSVNANRRGIYLGRLDRPAARAGEPLFYADNGVAYLPRAGGKSADLAYLANGRVEVREFDNSSLTAAATARTIKFLPAEYSLVIPIMASASEGVMAFADTVIPSGKRMALLTMAGRELRLWDKMDAHNWPRVSPDGRLIARLRMDDARSQPDIWIEDLERGTAYPLLNTLEPDMSPVWSPDGRQLAFVTGHLPGRQGDLKLNIAAADGTGIVHSLDCPGDYCEPTDWRADGSTLLVTVLEGGNRNVWTIATRAGGGAEPLLAAPYDEHDARYSPDGRWVAYVSEEAGRPVVLVHSVSGSPRRFVASGEGGTQPVWRRDGGMLYFADLRGQLQSVAVRWTTSGEPQFGLPTQPNLPRIDFGHWGTQYDVTPDGSRIFYMRPTDEPVPAQIQIAINWRGMID